MAFSFLLYTFGMTNNPLSFFLGEESEGI